MKASDTLKKKKAEVKKAVEDIVLSEFMTEVPAIIQNRTRAGSGITEPGGRKKPLKKLKPSTIARREKLADDGLLHPDTSPSTSNLTESGQVLDSLRLVPKSKKRVLVDATGTRPGGLTNSKLVDYIEKTRRFLGLTKVEIDQLEKRIAQAIKKSIRDIF